MDGQTKPVVQSKGLVLFPWRRPADTFTAQRRDKARRSLAKVSAARRLNGTNDGEFVSAQLGHLWHRNAH